MIYFDTKSKAKENACRNEKKTIKQPHRVW